MEMRRVPAPPDKERELTAMGSWQTVLRMRMAVASTRNSVMQAASV